MDFNQPGIGDPLMVEPVGLHFEIEVILAEDLLEFAGDRDARLSCLFAR